MNNETQFICLECREPREAGALRCPEHQRAMLRKWNDFHRSYPWSDTVRDSLNILPE